MKRISLLILSLLFFATAFQSDKLITQGWYQQYFPTLNGSVINSITFLDSLTGYAVTSTNSSVQGYIIKTTNGGNNWSIIYTYVPPSVNSGFRVIQFANDSVGYAATNYFTFFKTTNAGLNWVQLITPDGADGMAVINKDTVLVVTSDGFAGGVFRTTNGGYNWQAMGQTGGSGQPYTIYMYNKDMGFCLGGQMRKTTNGGVNWFAIPGETYSSIIFVDSLTGWKSWAGVKKTTNGGLNWFSQQLPNLPHSWVTSYVFALNKDTVWLVGDEGWNAPLYKTTNGGLNWGYQRADTSIHITVYDYIVFVTNNIGWAKSSYYNSIIHTTTGGNDTTYLTGIKLVPNIVPEKFSLGQNYPNPFNPTTNIPFELKEPSHVTLKVFDARGREVKELVNGRWGTGKFIADFDASQFATGIYFYQIIVSDESTHQTFTETRKMMFLK
ncbi:MAG: T9SS type A sorting domain-containing protein [Ignavibacteria bacterium]